LDLVNQVITDMASIQDGEWVARLSAVKLSRAMMNRLVMDYLVVEGHKEAAESFQAESGTPAGLDLDTISERRAIRSAIEGGEVLDAVRRAQRLIPDLLTARSDLSFHVLQQHLIELIRAGNVEDAVSFAQKELSESAEASPILLSELERTMLLLAYEDPDTAPEAELLSQAQRRRTASRLNSAMLSAQSQETEAALPMMLRRLHMAQEDLEGRHGASFARVDDFYEAVPRYAVLSDCGDEVMAGAVPA
jgi:hypothetical protein